MAGLFIFFIPASPRAGLDKLPRGRITGKELYVLKSANKGIVVQKGLRKSIMRERELWVGVVGSTKQAASVFRTQVPRVDGRVESPKVQATPHLRDLAL